MRIVNKTSRQAGSADFQSRQFFRGDPSELSICLVGPGWTFTSGISYYTCRLANAAADRYEIGVIPLRHLLPRRFYPGRKRVGMQLSTMKFHPSVSVCNGIDWWWGRSLLTAFRFLRAHRPKILVLEWWTAATLHTYVVLAILGHVFGARVVVEMHELQDTGEAGIAPVRYYGRYGFRALLHLSHGCVVHSKSDWRALERNYGSLSIRVAVAPHGPYDQYQKLAATDYNNEKAVAAVKAAPKPGVVNLLFFGTIRPYKGLEDLLMVFNQLSSEEAKGLWLTVVGETWEGWCEPARLIEASPHSDRITFLNDYVADAVVEAAFEHADVVVLPYRRSSSSGNLHVAMSWGLPVVVTSVGGLPEAADGYEGAIFVEPADLASLKVGVMVGIQMAGRRYVDPRNWNETLDAIRFAADSPATSGGTL